MQGRAWTNYQFIMEFLFKVMKKTWLLPPDLTEAKNTCEKEKNPDGGRLLFKASLSHWRPEDFLLNKAFNFFQCTHVTRLLV